MLELLVAALQGFLLVLFLAAAFLLGRLLADPSWRPWVRVPAPHDPLRELQRKLHASNAWHCGCRACRMWREVLRG